MKWPFRRKALTGDPGALDILGSRRGGWFPGLGGTNLNTQRIRAAFSTAQDASYAWMYASSPAVRTVVDLIARNGAQLDLRLYEELDESSREPRPDHPAAVSLRNPSPQQTRDQFVTAIFTDYLVFKNAYALKFRNRNSGRLILKPIPAHRVEILGEGLFDPEGYKITLRNGVPLFVDDPTDMIHWRGYNPDDPRVGISPLETLRSVVAEDAALQATLVELSKSGLAGPAWVYRPLEAPQWENVDRARFEEDLTARLRRANKTPPVMEEGMELRSDAMSPKDAEMLSARKWALEQVASLYGLHPASVGLDGDIEQAQKILYSDVLPPYCEAFTRTLDLAVLQDEYGESEFCFEFNLDEKHMGDDRIKSLVSATGRPVMLTNEARARLNLPPVDDGDELVTPLNVTVGEKPSVDVMPIQNPNGPEQDGSFRQEMEPAKGIKQLERSTVPRTTGDLARQQRYIDETAGVLERFYARQHRQVKGLKAFDRDKWDRELGDDIHRQVRSIVEREGGLYVARLLGDDFDMRQVENYLKAMAQGVAEGLNRVTNEDIAAVGVDDAFARARGERAETAAAAIGTRATVFARVEAGKQSPQAERRTKTWIANTDRHADMGGVSVPLDGSFGAIEPGSEPGCRCSVSVS